jgi:GNAT superfamily N-acetyltransferase
LIEYRRPHLDEAEAMAALHVQCWREAYATIIPQEVIAKFDVAAVTRSWADHLSYADRFILAAYDKGRAVGFINQGAPVEPYYDGMDGHIAALYVAAAHLRQGIGRKLLGAAAQDWLQYGGHSLALGVLSKNTSARAFYESRGGVIKKHGIFKWHGHDLPDVIYAFEDLTSLIP